ncbi:tyrosine-type recombinase/integrase [Geodermatophilus sp. URMC 61]|uniref:tyrosine-type recombinase/integrase n=1 Tax=Geodermatophilus sp. URMC 61 TaxID=3423411 RepID=UPI00406C1211
MPPATSSICCRPVTYRSRPPSTSASNCCKDAPHLTAEQAQALLEAIKGDRLETLFRVMLATGLRRGEALGLHWSDVDLDAGLLRVRDPLPNLPGAAARRAQDRQVPPDRATPPLGDRDAPAHRTRQLEKQQAAAGAWQEHGLVFPTEIGTPLEPRNVLRRFEVLAQRAGLRGVTLRTLRHSAASLLLAAGTHTKVVQEHLGHSSYAITADIYSHVGPAQQREAADRLDQALRW